MNTHVKKYTSAMIQLSAMILLALGLSTARVQAAAQATPPDLMTYQGYLVDGNQIPLGNTNTGPRNYDVLFKIYDASSAGNCLWGEQQTVTIDKGYFSVLLGEGSGISGIGHGSLGSVFAHVSGSERYIGISVKIPPSSDFVEIAPRLRLMSSPYAFLAKNAGTLVNVGGSNIVTLNLTSVGINKVANTSYDLDVNGAVNAAEYYGNGANLTAINASSISSGTIPASRLPALDGSYVSTGTISDSRLSANIVRQNASPNFGSYEVTAAKFIGNGTIPVGGIIMWNGTIANIPAGWKLCDGNNGTPNLVGRFVLGGGGSYIPNSTPSGAEYITITEGQLPAHNHAYRDAYHGEAGIYWPISGAIDIGYTFTGSAATDHDNRYLLYRDANTSDKGGGAAVRIMPPYYILAYIMRTQ